MLKEIDLVYLQLKLFYFGSQITNKLNLFRIIADGFKNWEVHTVQRKWSIDFYKV